MSETIPMPPQVALAKKEIEAALEGLEKRKLDLASEPWPAVEKAVIKLLKGPFRVDNPEHQVVALGVCAGFAERLNKSLGAFWFPNRDAVEGASLGFPEALLTLSPFEAVLEAFASAKLELLESTEKDIRQALAQVKFSAAAGPAPRLQPTDYQRLFDPSFVQMLAVDMSKVQQAFALTPSRLLLDARSALSRMNPRVSDALKKQLEQQLVGMFSRLNPDQSLEKQGAKAARVMELVAHLWGTQEATGAAPDDFWAGVVFPLVLVGAPKTLPPLDAEESAAVEQGVAPFYLYLEVVPHQFSVSDEEHLLGVFPMDQVKALGGGTEAAAAPRMVQVSEVTLAPALSAFDAAQSKASLERFSEPLRALQKGAGAEQQNMADAEMKAAYKLAGDLQKLHAAKKTWVLRRLTEAEAMSEAALQELRLALQGPRIILA